MGTMSTPTLYHYTCDHAHQLIGMRGKLKPNRHPWLTRPLLWLTDLDHANIQALGLTSLTLDCDRTAWRYRIRDGYTRGQPKGTVEPWITSRARRESASIDVVYLEMPPAQPEHWWISYSPLWGILDQPEVQP